MRVAFALVALLLAGCFSSAPDPQQDQSPTGALAQTHLSLETVVSGLEQPIAAVHGPDGLLYIAQQGGLIWRWDGHELAHFLDLGGELRSGGEQGLLGLAFDPSSADGRFVVDYTDKEGDTVIAAYHGDRGSESGPKTLGLEAVLLRIDQPYANHNGGALAFGPDGHLYIGMGDGGSGDDPQDHARDKSSLLGKILRIHVGNPDCSGSGCAAYTIPSDNPFLGQQGARGEVWAWGLRNPWRFSFDRMTGDLWIGDVGQNQWEEIDMQKAGSKGGEDYGWSGMEGTHVHDKDRVNAGSVPPVWEYSHAGGNSAVTGGFVYRGHAIPALNGTYLYADYGSGKLWGIMPGLPGSPPTNSLLLDTDRNISSFGEDPDGELHVVDLGGSVLRLVSGQAATTGPG
ncbi:MAG TPA: PQQ-dependent sugar dehydrogenase [Candidatus Thermoplasmatota archaeon]|nr:PQQ-dependent sugar dehydrogenase [Candidatus Thermoplasmatota archaeon]